MKDYSVRVLVATCVLVAAILYVQYNGHPPMRAPIDDAKFVPAPIEVDDSFFPPKPEQANPAPIEGTVLEILNLFDERLTVYRVVLEDGSRRITTLPSGSLGQLVRCQTSMSQQEMFATCDPISR